MILPTEIFGDCVVVHSPEELGNEHAEAFEKFISELERVNVVMDFDGTETIDSRGLTALLNCQDTLREVGGDLKLSTTNLSNRKILEMTRLDTRLEIFDSVVDAVRSYHH